MTTQEVNNLLALLKANYSYAFKSMSRDEKYLMLNSWTFALQDMDAQIVFLAAMKLLSVNKWVPTVAEIREKAQQIFFEAQGLIPDSTESMLISPAEKQRRIAASKAITSRMHHLHPDEVPELQLKSIVDNPQYAQMMNIGTNTMGLTGNTFRLEGAEEEQSP